MEEPTSLEDYLRTAEIDLFGDFEAAEGGGHPSKELVVLRGGIGALAKLALSEPERRQCRSEAGAYVVAHALGWDDLIPVTVLRAVPTREGQVDASVQILWPAFATAAELGLDEATVPGDDALRTALIDGLLLNSDRHSGNWGLVAGARLGLIDHGHTAISGLGGISGFYEQWRGHPLDDEHRGRLESFVEHGVGRLQELLDDEGVVQSIAERASSMLAADALVADE